MTEPAPTNVPRLAAGCRMTQSADLGPVLLLPESMLRLTGPGPRIVELCDGTRTREMVLEALQELLNYRREKARTKRNAVFEQVVLA